MIIFELLLTIFEANFIFRGSWGSTENWLEPKTKPPSENLIKLSLSKSTLRTVKRFSDKLQTKQISKKTLLR